jgi:tetratricopeptide (TPR) repeat protein
MLGWLRNLAACGKRRLGRALAIVFLLALIGLGLVPLAYMGWGEYHYRAAEKANRQRDFAGAREHISKALRVFPRGPKTRLLAARIARRAGNLGEAMDQLDVCNSLVDSSQELFLERLLVHAQAGDMRADVETRFRMWVDEGHPDSVLILEVLSQQLMRGYRLGEALDSLDQWLKLAPDDILALQRRAWVYERLNRIDEAIDDYVRLLELSPQLEDPRLKLAVALLLKKEVSEALKHFQILHDQGSRSREVLIGLAECQWQSGELDESERILKDLDASRPHDPEVVMLLGRIANARGQSAEAEARFREAANRLPWSYPANIALYQCLEALDKKAEAQIYLDKANRAVEEDQRLIQLTQSLGKSRQDATIPYEIGKLLLRRDETKDGVGWLLRALQINPKLKAAHEALADYYDSIHEKEKATHHRQLAGDDEGTTPPAGASLGARPR